MITTEIKRLKLEDKDVSNDRQLNNVTELACYLRIDHNVRSTYPRTKPAVQEQSRIFYP